MSKTENQKLKVTSNRTANNMGRSESLFQLTFISFACYLCAQGSFLEGTVYMNKGSARFVAGKLDKNGAAYGTFNNSLFSTGWSVLNVKAGFSQKPTSNVEMAFAAGYFEGVATAEQIWQNYQNLYPYFFAGKSNATVAKTKKFFKDQDVWTRNMIEKFGKTDPLWRHVSYVLAQFDGLYAGYISVAKNDWEKDVFVVQVLNGVGDLLDLIHAVAPESRPDFSKMTPEQVFATVLNAGHCSALVKVTGAFENVFMAHSSWFIYESMNRIYKHYSFNFQDTHTAAQSLSFSSYPGFLESLDDFYLLGSKMVLLQTTNNVFNMTLYDAVQPQALFAWQRVRVANYMANSGKQWADVLRRYNSGTYNNQYMVIDLKQIEVKKNIHDNALWLVEQIPTKVEAADVTPILRAGYWPSYNVPFFESIYNKSGYPEFVFMHGLGYSYQLAARAKIYRRDQDNVTSMEALKYMMRYNDYREDPYSGGNPCNTICCRGDLNKMSPRPVGCYDTKVTDLHMALARQSYAINGPTVGGRSKLEPFEWTGQFAKYPHVGLPEKYAFSWQFMAPELP